MQTKTNLPNPVEVICVLIREAHDAGDEMKNSGDVTERGGKVNADKG